MRITKRNSSFLATIYTDRKETFYRLLAADSSWQQQSLNLVQRRPVKMINGETVSPPDRPILAPWTFFFRATVDNPNNDWTYFHIHLPEGGGRLSHINLITASVNWGEMYKKLLLLLLLHFPRMVFLAIFCLLLLSSLTPSLASPYSALACRPDMLRLVPARVQEICSLLALVQVALQLKAWQEILLSRMGRRSVRTWQEQQLLAKRMPLNISSSGGFKSSCLPSYTYTY